MDGYRMAKKREGPTMDAAAASPKPNRTTLGKAVRLELSPEDYARLDRRARELGLTKASYARMAVMRQLKNEDAVEAKRP